MWLIDMCDVTHLCDTTHETTQTCTWNHWGVDYGRYWYVCNVTHLCDRSHGMTLVMWVTCDIHMCNMTHSYAWHDIHMCDMTFICVTCQMRDPYVRHDSWYDSSHDSHVYLECWLCNVASISSIRRNTHCVTPYNTHCNTLQQKLQRIRMCWL